MLAKEAPTISQLHVDGGSADSATSYNLGSILETAV